LLLSFHALCPRAEEYYRELGQRRFNPRVHIAKIMDLSEVYAPAKVARAIEDAFKFAVFFSDYGVSVFGLAMLNSLIAPEALDRWN
jgi:hypothetical protein